MINYFNFKKMNGKYLLTNDLGMFIFLEPDQFHRLLKCEPTGDLETDDILEELGFTYHGSKEAFTQENHFYLREAKNYVFDATQLHIFVVTTACNMQCVYCQAQNGQSIPSGMMDIETARKAVDIALQSPANNLQFEFQGGEPLLNFELIKFIVEYSQQNKQDKNIGYCIVSNLTLLTDDMLEFIAENKIGISTSIDGPESLHNKNRPFRTGEATYKAVNKSLQKVREHGIQAGALLTTTRNTLSDPIGVVDSYLENGFHSISLRALTPLGCAKMHWSKIGYTPEEFLEFYKTAFEHIIKINIDGTRFDEGMATIFLRKILTGAAINYMELRSPCGAAIGQIAYYCDGRVFTCDEGRMIAEMGNDSFQLGTVDNSYSQLMDSNVCKAVCGSSILESLPSCFECVYQPYCGVCPAVNYALHGDLFEKHPRDYRCKIYGGMLDIIFEKLQKGGSETERILRSWIS